MSDKRDWDYVLKKLLPRKAGAKEGRICTIEVYTAGKFAKAWKPWKTGETTFCPRVPLQQDARNLYWETHYRLRINGKWHKRNDIQYTFVTLAEMKRISLNIG